jgi:hypothetical protein
MSGNFLQSIATDAANIMEFVDAAHAKDVVKQWRDKALLKARD